MMCILRCLQIVSECRQDVSLAFRNLQAKGRISGISLEDLRSALATMWDTQDNETRVRSCACKFACKFACACLREFAWSLTNGQNVSTQRCRSAN